MVIDVSCDLNCWIDITYTPRGDELGKANAPDIEFVEMLWDEAIRRAIITRSVKYEARPM
jgi:hypothetical protein